jgi:hypothetical protein
MSIQNQNAKRILLGVVLFLLIQAVGAFGAPTPTATQTRMFEGTFASSKIYADPFNDVDVDVIFTNGQQSWRMPTFWDGGSKWTVRFAPPAPGEYTYHLESTDKNNPDLNGHESRITIRPYDGTNVLLQHGMPRVSENKRYFEYADGTPFYWLGDTWWTGLSDRISWEGFQKLTADRKAKGFTVVQIVAGMIPNNEEEAPIDAGYRNEGGAVYDPQFKQVNPKYFDYADRRIQTLVNAGITPAIVGAWRQALAQMGIAKMEKHWRYIIARYGAYPVFWIVGGEVYDPNMAEAQKIFGDHSKEIDILRSPGWSEVARYIRATDPLHHPVTVHEIPPPYRPPLNDESLTDFDLFQPSHLGWSSIAVEVALLDATRSRTWITKPEVVGEIGYEGIGGTHLEDFQRVAFWLSMLNGAAGHTYGANPVFEGYSTDKPFQRAKYTFLTWEEGMNLPGGYQVSLGARLLRKYPWWQFEPHPEWVSPRGTTLLEPRDRDHELDLGNFLEGFFSSSFPQPLNMNYPGGEWKKHDGNFFLPYAAGIPGKVRFVYIPCFGLACSMATSTAPTILGLEKGVRYRAYYWEPMLGVKIDLGNVERPAPGSLIRGSKFDENDKSNWIQVGTKNLIGSGRMSAAGNSLAIANGVNETDLVASVDGRREANAGLVLRYHDADNYLAAIYSPTEKSVYVVERKKGINGHPLGSMPVTEIDPNFHLSAEVRGKWAAVSISDGEHTYTSSIVAITDATAGGAGLLHEQGGIEQSFTNFELRKSPTLVTNGTVEKKIYDAQGKYRGELKGPGWDEIWEEKLILLDSYRPPKLPMPQDWVLVLDGGK